MKFFFYTWQNFERYITSVQWWQIWALSQSYICLEIFPYFLCRYVSQPRVLLSTNGLWTNTIKRWFFTVTKISVSMGQALQISPAGHLESTLRLVTHTPKTYNIPLTLYMVRVIDRILLPLNSYSETLTPMWQYLKVGPLVGN